MTIPGWLIGELLSRRERERQEAAGTGDRRLLEQGREVIDPEGDPETHYRRSVQRDLERTPVLTDEEQARLATLLTPIGGGEGGGGALLSPAQKTAEFRKWSRHALKRGVVSIPAELLSVPAMVEQAAGARSTFFRDVEARTMEPVQRMDEERPVTTAGKVGLLLGTLGIEGIKALGVARGTLAATEAAAARSGLPRLSARAARYKKAMFGKGPLLERAEASTLPFLPYDVMTGAAMAGPEATLGERARSIATNVALDIGGAVGIEAATSLTRVVRGRDLATGAKVFDLPEALQVNHPWRESAGPAAQTIVDLTERHNGATYNPRLGGSLALKDLYSVSIFPDRTTTVHGKPTVQQIEQFTAKNADVLADPRISVGTWYNDKTGMTEIDLTATLDDRAAAMALGRRYNQQGITSLKDLSFIETGGTGAALADLPPAVGRLDEALQALDVKRSTERAAREAVAPQARGAVLLRDDLVPRQAGPFEGVESIPLSEQLARNIATRGDLEQAGQAYRELLRRGHDPDEIQHVLQQHSELHRWVPLDTFDKRLDRFFRGTAPEEELRAARRPAPRGFTPESELRIRLPEPERAPQEGDFAVSEDQLTAFGFGDKERALRGKTFAAVRRDDGQVFIAPQHYKAWEMAYPELTSARAAPEFEEKLMSGATEGFMIGGKYRIRKRQFPEVLGGTKEELLAKEAAERVELQRDLDDAAKEYIGPAAMYDEETGIIGVGENHYFAELDAVQKGLSPDRTSKLQAGFLTSRGEFVNRYRAQEIAERVQPELLSRSNKLHAQREGRVALGSEDIQTMNEKFAKHAQRIRELREKWGMNGNGLRAFAVAMSPAVVANLLANKDDADDLDVALAMALLVPFGKRVGKKFRINIDVARRLAGIKPRGSEILLRQLSNRLTVGRPGHLFHAAPEKRIAHGLATGWEELKLAVEHFRKSGRDPSDWYKKTITEMTETLQETFPELKSPSEMFRFRVLLAMTSSGEDPVQNMRQAVLAWEGQRGEVVSRSARGTTLEASLEKFDNLIREFGGSDDPSVMERIADWLGTEVEVPYQGGRRTVKVSEMGSGQPYLDPATGKRKRWGGLLGPKTGAFYLNISGDWRAVTVDMWAARQYRRWMGYTGLAAKREPKAVGKGWDYAKGTGPGGRAWSSLDNKVDPFERVETQRIYTGLADRWSKEAGQHLDPADVQAIMWYWEKELYHRAGRVGGLDLAPDFGGIGTKPELGKDFAEAARVVAGERGQRSLELPGGVAGALAGGAGAAEAQEGEGGGAARFGLGAILGAAAGIGAARLFRRGVRGAPGRVAPAARIVEPPTRVPGQPARLPTPTAPEPPHLVGLATPEKLKVSDVKPELGERDFDVHLTNIRRDPSGRVELATRVKQLKESGRMVGRTETFAETRTKAAEVSIDQALKRGGGKLVSGEEGIALRAMYNTNSKYLQDAYRKLQVTPAGTSEYERLVSDIAQLDERQNAILTRYVTGISEVARSLNAAKADARMTLDPLFWHTKALRNLGPNGVLLPEMKARIADLIERGNRDGLAEYVESLRKSSLLDKVLTFRKAGLISALVSPGRAIIGNSSRAMASALAAPATAVADVFLSAITGFRSRTFANLRVQAAAARGALNGLREMGDVLRGRAGSADVATKIDAFQQTRFKNRLIDWWVNLPFRVQGALDRPFRMAAMERAIAEQAEVIARSVERLRGPELRERVRFLTENPTADMVMIAAHEAERAVFQNQTGLSRAALGARRGVANLPGFKTAFDIAVPFVRTPSAVISAGVEHTPLGALASAGDLWRLWRAANQENVDDAAVRELQRLTARRIGGWTTFTLAVWMGYEMYQNGRMTAERPKGAEGDKFDAQGKLPYAIRIGDRYYSTAQTQPLAAPLAFGAQIASATEKEDVGLAEAAVKGTFAVTKLATETPFLKGTKDIVEAMSEERKAQRAGEEAVGSFVPSGVASVARATEPLVRQPQGLVERVESRIPGLTGRAQPKIDPLTGEEIPKEAGPGAQTFFGLADVLGSRQARTSPLLEEMDRVGAAISDLTREKDETPEAYTERRRQAGRAVANHLGQVIHDDMYRSIPEWFERAEDGRAFQAAVLEDEVSGVRRRASKPDELQRFTATFALRLRDRLINETRRRARETP